MVDGDRYRVPASPCPDCKHIMDHGRLAYDATGDGGGPEVGSVAICIRCASILVYGDGLVLRKATDGELQDMKQDRTGWDTIQAIIYRITERGGL